MHFLCFLSSSFALEVQTGGYFYVIWAITASRNTGPQIITTSKYQHLCVLYSRQYAIHFQFDPQNYFNRPDRYTGQAGPKMANYTLHSNT